MQATLTPVASATTAPVSTSTEVKSAPRRRVIHDMATLFPEVSNIVNSVASKMTGFAEPGLYVPVRKPGFIQEATFMEEFTSFVANDSEYMLTIFGPTGCGKTERVLDFYSRLNIPVMHTSAHAEMRPYHLTGSKELTVNPKTLLNETTHKRGPLYRAMINGWPFLIDEAFRLSSTVTSKFHQIGDCGELYVDETGETITAKPGFKFIMTANQGGYGDSSGFYPGDNDQDTAYLNRAGAIYCGYPAAEIEEEIVLNTLAKLSPSFRTDQTLIDMAFPKKMVAVANKIRSLYIGNEDDSSTSDRVEIAVSTRTLILWATKFVHFKNSTNGDHPLYRGLDYAILRRACAATKATVDALILAEFAIERTDAS